MTQPTVQAPSRHRQTATDKRSARDKFIGTAILITNVTCLVFYLYFASYIWAPHEDKGLFGGPGDAIIWVVFALPFIVICIVVNAILLPGFCARAILRGRWRSLATLFVCIMLWVAAVSYDSSRQYNGSKLRSIQSLPDN